MASSGIQGFLILIRLIIVAIGLPDDVRLLIVISLGFHEIISILYVYRLQAYVP